MLMPNVDITTVEPLLTTCSQYPNSCLPMMGLHPTSVDENYKEHLDVILKIATQYNFIAIGEIGLDLYWDKSRIDDQIASFRAQIEWAIEYDLPIVIHSRDSFTQLYEVMSHYRDCGLRGVFHCFSGSADEAAALMEFSGFMFGIGGVLTYKKSTLPAVLPLIPMERVVLETDCPYLSPVPYRGKRNEPSYIVSTAAVMAQVYGCTVDQVAEKTNLNARRLFRL